MCGTRCGAPAGSPRPGSRPSPLVTTPCSSPHSNSTCIPTQMPSTGRPRRPGRRSPARRPARRCRPCRRRTHPPPVPPGRRPGGRVEVGGDRDLGADPLERSAERSCPTRSRAHASPEPAWQQDARRPPGPAEPASTTACGAPGSAATRPPSSPRDGDSTTGSAHSTPLVLGTPPPRGSIATASRSARATALNCASTTWCGVGCGTRAGGPQHRTCRVSRAAWPERLPDVPGHRGRVDRADVRAPAAGSSCTTYGRPDRSTAACTSTSSSGISAPP